MRQRRGGWTIGSGGTVVPRVAITAVLAGFAGCAPADERQRMPPATLLSAPGVAEEEWDAVASPVETSAPPAVTEEPTPVMEVEPEAPPAEPEESPDPHAYPEWNGYDLDCPDVGRLVRVTGSDPHGLDRDGDGWGCEKYGR